MTLWRGTPIDREGPGDHDLSRRQLITSAGVGALMAAVGGIVLVPDGTTQAWDGASRVLLTQTAPHELNVKYYGAGWPYTTIYCHYQLWRDGRRIWQDPGRKYTGTSFVFRWTFDCGPGSYYASCKAHSLSPKKGPFMGTDNIWVI